MGRPNPLPQKSRQSWTRLFLQKSDVHLNEKVKLLTNMKEKFEKQTIENNIKWLSFYSIALIPTSWIHHLICDDIKCKKQTNKNKQSKKTKRFGQFSFWWEGNSNIKFGAVFGPGHICLSIVFFWNVLFQVTYF